MLKKDIYITVILDYIKAHDDENILIDDIVKRYNTNRTQIDRRLKILKDNGIISREGKRYKILKDF